MDFQQFLSEAPIQSLLCLMLIPVLGALALGGYLAFSVTRRNKKTEMKLGITPKPAQQEAPEVPVPVEPSAQIDEPADDNVVELDLGILSKSRQQETDMDGKPEMAAPQPENQADVPPAAQPDLQTQPQELLRLLRDPQSGRLIVEVGGQQFYRLSDIADKKMGHFVLKIAAHLLAFTNGVIVTDAGMKSIYNPKDKVSAVPAPLVVPEPPPVPPADAEATLLAAMAAPATPPAPTPTTRRGLFGFGKSSPAPTKIPSLNLADEINDIVQRRLSQSPLAADNRLEISSDPGGGIRITVNGQGYSSPDDIPDFAIRDLIKESIREWEKS
ncbi:MAG: hypothetical protein D6768_02630 [Chloroflexi bacterium]|nr:MAG: hypothetical protein D6768_02630 [Chloroflexota bacterium]